MSQEEGQDDIEPDARAERLARQRRQLLAELQDVRRELGLRTVRLLEVRDSRWFALGRLTWQVRRSRRLTVAAAGGVVCLTAGLAAAVSASGPRWTALGAAVAGAVLLAACVRVGWRRQRAGEARWRSVFATSPAAVIELDEEHLPVGEPTSSEPSRSERPSPVRAPRPDRKRVRVAAVIEEATVSRLAPECDLVRVSAENWRDAVGGAEPELLLVEAPSGAVPELVDWCRTCGIPTVFWNSLGPLHLPPSQAVASLFDHVVIADADLIATYRQLGDTTVTAMPPAVQPRLHNPIGSRRRRDRRAAFVATEDAVGAEAERDRLEMLLDAARPFGLVVYDATSGSEGAAERLPERFAEHVSPRLSVAELGEAYQRHAVFLNFEPASDSPTACSRSVFELLACGTPVVSTRSKAIAGLLGDAVTVVDSVQEATAALDRLIYDEAYRRDVGLRGWRAVLREHTYERRLATILETAGVPVPNRPQPSVAALLVAEDPDLFSRAANQLAVQTRAPDEVLVWADPGVAVDGGLAMLERAFPAATLRLVHQTTEHPVSERFRKLAVLARSLWVAPILPGAAYPLEHLELLLDSALFADADAIGGTDPPDSPPSEEHTFVAALDPRAAIMRRDSVARTGWPGTDDELQAWFRGGARLYRTDTSFRAVHRTGDATPPRRRSFRRRVNELSTR